MCGIGGAWIKNLSFSTIEDLNKLIKLSTLRGEDSIGICIIRPDNTRVEYYSFKYSESQILSFLGKIAEDDRIMWCCRALSVTERQDVFQPVKFKNLTAVHNGVVSNDKELTEEYGIQNASGVDSEVVLHLISKFGMVEAFRKCTGGFAYVVTDSENIILVRDFKALAVGTNNGNVWYVSEEKWLKALKITPLEFKPYTILTMNSSFEPKYQELVTKKISYLPEINPKKVVVCASGGIDSTTAAYILKNEGYEVNLVHFQYGQKAASGELNAVTAISKDLDVPLKVIDMSWIGELG
ncbi:MAG: 7-cyano-7-deazaguanine synthase, partial [Nanoarchaeota archaeon]